MFKWDGSLVSSDTGATHSDFLMNSSTGLLTEKHVLIGEISRQAALVIWDCSPARNRLTWSIDLIKAISLLYILRQFPFFVNKRTFSLIKEHYFLKPHVTINLSEGSGASSCWSLPLAFSFLINFQQRRENACYVAWMRLRMSPIKHFTALWSNAAFIQSNLWVNPDVFFIGLMEEGRTEGLDLLFKSCSKGLRKEKKEVSLHKNKLYTKARSRITATACSHWGIKRKFKILV